MRRLLALILVVTLWFGFVQPASADFANLVPCSESPVFQQKAQLFRNTTSDPQSGQNRADRYSQALCGADGYPHLIVDGRLSHMGDFLIPSILFLYIAGWIGWAGRAYLIAIRDGSDPEKKEVIIEVPLALSKMFASALWPLLALQEFTTGKLVVKNSEVPVSPR